MPSCWLKTCVACYNRFIEFVINGSILVCVANKHLKHAKKKQQQQKKVVRWTNGQLVAVSSRDANRIVFKTNTVNMKFEYLAEVLGNKRP